MGLVHRHSSLPQRIPGRRIIESLRGSVERDHQEEKSGSVGTFSCSNPVVKVDMRLVSFKISTVVEIGTYQALT